MNSFFQFFFRLLLGFFFCKVKSFYKIDYFDSNGIYAYMDLYHINKVINSIETKRLVSNHENYNYAFGKLLGMRLVLSMVM